MDRAPEPVLPVGLIAGGGTFPIEVARAARRGGAQVICAGIRLEASPELRAEVDVYRKIGLLSLGSYFRYFRRHGVERITWAGWVRKERLLTVRGGHVR